MEFGYCNLSIIALRAQPSHRSEMVSQLLYGEYCEILQVEAEWTQVRTVENKYEGWIQHRQYTLTTAEEVFKADDPAIVGLQGAYLYGRGQRINLLHGTKVSAAQRAQTAVSPVQGTLRQAQLVDFDSEFPKLIEHYNFAPYLWGGRSAFGIDCSGLSGLFYAHFGISLPRDAWQQAEQGSVVDFHTEIVPGDLAFFDNEEGKITHVGIMIDAQTIIHASAMVRIDRMDAEGIFNTDLHRYTHKLRIIKRYF